MAAATFVVGVPLLRGRATTRTPRPRPWRRPSARAPRSRASSPWAWPCALAQVVALPALAREPAGRVVAGGRRRRPPSCKARAAKKKAEAKRKQRAAAKRKKKGAAAKKRAAAGRHASAPASSTPRSVATAGVPTARPVVTPVYRARAVDAAEEDVRRQGLRLRGLVGMGMGSLSLRQDTGAAPVGAALWPAPKIAAAAGAGWFAASQLADEPVPAAPAET